MEKVLETVNSQDYLKKHGKAGTKIKFNSRVKVEIIKETKHYKVGDVITPHETWANELIEKKIAKKVKVD